MRWLDPMPTDCPGCGGRFPIPVAELRSLRAVCPGCGGSLGAVGERMLAEEARIGGEVDLFQVGYELSERYALPDDVLLGSRTLGDLARAVAGRLDPAADREARAAEIVAEVAGRVAPLLLREDGPAERLARLRLASSKHAEPSAGADGGGM
jgi:hypothetical protein